MSKRANGQGTIRQRADGLWEGMISVNGKRKSVYGKTQKEVRTKMSALSVAIDNGTYFEPSKMTLGQWLDDWTDNYLNNVKPTTARSYKIQIKEHIKPNLGNIKLSKLNADDIKKFYNHLSTDGRQLIARDETGKPIKVDGKNVMECAGLSAKSIKNIHGVLTRCLNDAVDMGLIQVNVAERVSNKLPRVEKKEISILDDAQQKLLIANCKDDVYGYIFRILLFTGMRESECLGLTWDCVDFNNETITIKQQLVANGADSYSFGSPKNSKTRTISPAPFVFDLLKSRKSQQGKDKLAMGSEWITYDKKRQLVFTSEVGKFINPHNLYNHYKRNLAPQIGAPDSVVHALRHTHVVVRLQNMDDIKTISQDVGHASVAFTMDVYAHVSRQMRENSRDKMQAYIQSLG